MQRSPLFGLEGDVLCGRSQKRRSWTFDFFLQHRGSIEIAADVDGIPPDIAAEADNYTVKFKDGTEIKILGGETSEVAVSEDSNGPAVAEDQATSVG
ncbi:MAG: hypothetical protein IH921_09390 [Gemmatimonadetes bacterium]|nr:hypothetical protein [Gemmatimonadota bacterium]